MLNLKSQKFLLAASSVMGFLGVAFGAFGAHALKSILTPEMMVIFEKGIFYQLIHSSVILAIALSGIEKFYKPAIFFLAGIILFSFSLYLYSVTSIKLFALITPFGGVSFLTGWLLLAIKAMR